MFNERLNMKIVKVYLVGIVFIGICTGFSYGKDHPQKTKKMGTYGSREELKLCIRLAKVTTRWLKSANVEDAKQCEQLVSELMSLPEPAANSYFVAAKTMELINRPDKAISYLQQVIGRYGDSEDTPHFKMPIKIFGSFWIGAVYRHSGKALEAERIYTVLLTDIEKENIPGKEAWLVTCNIYLSELAKKNKQKDIALKRLKAIQSTKVPEVPYAKEMFRLFNNWAAYQQTSIIADRMQANRQLTTEQFEEIPMMATMQLQLNGSLFAFEGGASDKSDSLIRHKCLSFIIETGKSDFDNECARLMLGKINEEEKQLSKAEKYYSDLFEGDSYFSPVAGIYLATLQKAQGKTNDADTTLEKIKTKFPGYSNAVKDFKEKLSN